VCAFDQDGFSILPGAFGTEEIESLIAAVSRIGGEQGVRSRTGVYAIRNLL